jgi:hypothetical protein
MSPAKSPPKSTDAIVLLKADHREVAQLFTEYEKSATTAARKRAIVAKVIELLTVHTYLENEIVYPQVKSVILSHQPDATAPVAKAEKVQKRAAAPVKRAPAATKKVAVKTSSKPKASARK